MHSGDPGGSRISCSKAVCWQSSFLIRGSRSFILLKYIYFIDYVITVIPYFSPLYSPLPCTPLLPSFPHLSSSPWVIHIKSLAFLFPILFLTSPCQFCTYHVCFLFSVLLFHSPHTPSLLITLHLYFCELVPVLVVCLFRFCFFRFSC